MNRHFLRFTWIALSLFVSDGQSEDKQPVAFATAWPAPRAALPDMPKNGDGVYRLNLDWALGAAPLTLIFELRDGKAVRAAGLPNRTAQAWCPADANRRSPASFCTSPGA